MSFVQRKITAVISLANGQFGNGANSKTVSASDGVDTNAPWISCHINNAGGAFGSQAQITIYGMSLSDMLQLSTIGSQMGLMNRQNHITISAGDDVTGMPLVFSGNIFFAFVDGQDQKNMCLRITAVPGGAADAQTVNSYSLPVSGDVTGMLSNLASQGNFTFEPNNVTGLQISKPYLWGSVGTQIKQVVQAAGIEHIIDKDNLAVWKPGTARGLPVVTLGPNTDPVMIGYPAFNQAAVICRSMFNAQIQNGGTLALQTSLKPAVGNWAIVSTQHQIDANIPGGKWETHIQASGFKAGTTP